MRIKSKPQDFRVRELLGPGYLQERGPFRVYRVEKRKLTSLDAARELAAAAGVKASDVGMAGLKDRQGVTTQYMSVRGGRVVDMRTSTLSIATAGFARAALTSARSAGNAFEIVLRNVSGREHERIEAEAEVVRQHGLPNYFGEQRFGNLRHGQGWVARELCLGRAEEALKLLLASPSENDPPRLAAFKRGLQRTWGDWRSARDVAGAHGAHHSVFEHLARHDGDFAGAFRYVKSELRLIHLYAWQSHVWNRAVARWLTEALPGSERFMVSSIEGPLVFARGALPIPPTWRESFRLPGPRLEDVDDREQHRHLEAALATEGLDARDFAIEGVSGFALKGEDRPLAVWPRELRVETALRDPSRLRVSFELPRGAYATLVLARLSPGRAPSTPDTTGGVVSHVHRDPPPERDARPPRRDRGERAPPRSRAERKPPRSRGARPKRKDA